MTTLVTAAWDKSPEGIQARTASMTDLSKRVAHAWLLKVAAPQIRVKFKNRRGQRGSEQYTATYEATIGGTKWEVLVKADPRSGSDGRTYYWVFLLPQTQQQIGEILYETWEEVEGVGIYEGYRSVFPGTRHSYPVVEDKDITEEKAVQLLLEYLQKKNDLPYVVTKALSAKESQ